MADLYDIASSGMAAQRVQMDLIAENLANAGIPRADGTVFRAKTALLSEASPFSSVMSDPSELDLADLRFAGEDDPATPSGVEVASVVERSEDPVYRYDPKNPYAARTGLHKGYIAMPEVDPIEQMVSLVSAGRAYDANVSMLEAAKQMDLEAADIDRLT